MTVGFRKPGELYSHQAIQDAVRQQLEPSKGLGLKLSPLERLENENTRLKLAVSVLVGALAEILPSDVLLELTGHGSIIRSTGTLSMEEFSVDPIGERLAELGELEHKTRRAGQEVEELDRRIRDLETECRNRW